jgi:large subunit ribosomal protein L25
MAERISLVGEIREVPGEKAKNLRKEGWIPAVIYGQGENLLIKVDNLTLRRGLRSAGTTNLIDISVEKGKHTVLAKDIQTHPTRGDLVHVDFYEVNMAEKIVVDAALVSVGIAAPEEDGLGVATLVIYSVEIECLPDNLVSEIEVDMTLIETPDDVITVSDLEVAEGVEILTDTDAVIASFEYARLEEEEEEEEEELFITPSAEDVEVIGKGKQEEEEEEEYLE